MNLEVDLLGMVWPVFPLMFFSLEVRMEGVTVAQTTVNLLVESKLKKFIPSGGGKSKMRSTCSRPSNSRGP